MPKKQHVLAGIVEFARKQPVDMVEAAIALMRGELKMRKPGTAVSTPTKVGRPRNVPPVNEASRLSADGQLIG